MRRTRRRIGTSSRLLVASLGLGLASPASAELSARVTSVAGDASVGQEALEIGLLHGHGVELGRPLARGFLGQVGVVLGGHAELGDRRGKSRAHEI